MTTPHNDAVGVGPYSKRTAYVLLAKGKIKSRLVRHKGSTSGIRLIDFASVRDFLAAASEETPNQPKATLVPEHVQ